MVNPRALCSAKCGLIASELTRGTAFEGMCTRCASKQRRENLASSDLTSPFTSDKNPPPIFCSRCKMVALLEGSDGGICISCLRSPKFEYKCLKCGHFAIDERNDPGLKCNKCGAGDWSIKEQSTQPDPINPTYYQGDRVMCIIEEFNLGFRLGTVAKYILRAGKKGNRKEDLRKALWYLEREIAKGAD